jgi:lipoprotein-anchoring transpeptidase ErfK/SrfK
MKAPTGFMRLAALLWLFLAACDGDVRTDQPVVERDTVRDTVFVAGANAGDSASFLDASEMPVTLPVLDGFFQDSTFAATLRDSLQIDDQQITELRKIAREEASRLDSDSASTDTSMVAGTMGARQRALQRISGIIGPEKTYHLARIVRTQWSGTAPAGITMGQSPNSIPSDTRIVINAPAFRMDLFENGQLVKSYPVAIGYPEFPLPTGMRQASQIIFNPAWTPPDEPWVEAPGSKVKVGEKVDPGSKLNPLGIMKIPIGGPSLIHGGKSAGQIGGFGSHGCAGLTNEQAREFVRLLSEVSGTSLTDKQIAEYGKKKDSSQTVRLPSAIPVELRYETIVVEDGAVHLYPDVYDRGANTEANLRAALQAQGVSLEQLTEPERTKLMNAFRQMGGSAGDSTGAMASTGRSDTASKKTAAADTSKGKVKVTRSVKGPKELIVPIAALKGKGYPKMMKTAKRPAAGAKKDTTV